MNAKRKVEIPKRGNFYAPTLQALHELGGSGTVSEIDGKVVLNEDITIDEDWFYDLFDKDPQAPETTAPST